MYHTYNSSDEKNKIILFSMRYDGYYHCNCWLNDIPMYINICKLPNNTLERYGTVLFGDCMLKSEAK